MAVRFNPASGGFQSVMDSEKAAVKEAGFKWKGGGGSSGGGGSYPQSINIEGSQAQIDAQREAQQRLEQQRVLEERQKIEQEASKKQQETIKQQAVRSKLEGDYNKRTAVLLEKKYYKEYVPPEKGSYGLGGKWIYKDKEGNVVAESSRVLEATEKPKTIIGKTERYLETTREQARRGEMEGKVTPVTLVKGFVAGAGTSAIQTAKTVKSFITEPVQTIKEIPEGTKRTIGFVTSGELARVLKEEPAFATGYAVTEYYTMKGTGKAGKSVTTKLSSKFPDISIKSPVKVIKPTATPKYKTMAEKFAGKPVVFKGGEVIGRELKFIEQARANIQRSPMEFDIQPTLKTQTQLTRLEKGLDIVEYTGKKFKIRESPKPEALKSLFKEEPALRITIDESYLKQQKLRFERELDIVELTKEGRWKIRESPKPEALKSLFKEKAPIKISLTPEMETKLRSQLNRIKSEADIIDISKEGIKVKSAPKEKLGTFYTGTTEKFAKDILTKGLKEESWVTRDIQRAKGYAGRKYVQTAGESRPVVLELKLKPSEIISKDLAEGVKVREIPSGRIKVYEEKLDIVSSKVPEIRQLALERFKLSNAKPIKQIKTIKDFEKQTIDFDKTIGVSKPSSKQQLVQVMKEPEIKVEVKPKLKTFEDISFEKDFPDFKIPGSKFTAPEGKIKSFTGTGRIKTLELEGRIPQEILEPKLSQAKVSKSLQTQESKLLKDTELKGAVELKTRKESAFGFPKRQEQITRQKSITIQTQRNFDNQMDKIILSESFAQPSATSLRQPQLDISITKQSYRFAQPQPQRQPQAQRYRFTDKDLLKEITITKKKKKKFKMPSFESEKKKSILAEPSFELFVIEKKKPRTIAKGISREIALDLGVRETARGLKATFGIRPSREPLRKDLITRQEFRRYSKLYREPAIKSPYRKYGEVFVQKQTKTDIGTGRLTFVGEKREIQRARKIKMENYLN